MRKSSRKSGEQAAVAPLASDPAGALALCSQWTSLALRSAVTTLKFRFVVSKRPHALMLHWTHKSCSSS